MGNVYKYHFWSTTATTPSVKITTPGTYWVKVTDNNLCTNTDTVKIKQAPLPSVNLGHDTILCEEKTFTLNAGNGFKKYM